MKVLVYCEHSNGKIKKGSMEILSNAAAWGVETHAVLMGSNLNTMVSELQKFSVKKAHLVENGELNQYSPEGYSAALAEVAKSISADLVLGSVSAQVKDFFPRASVKLDTALASDCTFLSVNASAVEAKRPMFSGKVLATVDFKGAKPAMATVRPNSLGMKAEKPGNTESVSASVTLPTIRAKVKEVVAKAGASSKVDLTEADRIVSGGRSLKNAENFKILEDLASVIGATVGASRAAVDAGYRPHSDQVGQTGKTVSPSIYFAFGISGAIQHLAGMRSSKLIVAVNTDANAPIFQKADIGIVADLFQVAPALTEEFKKALH